MLFILIILAFCFGMLTGAGLKEILQPKIIDFFGSKWGYKKIFPETYFLLTNNQRIYVKKISEGGGCYHCLTDRNISLTIGGSLASDIKKEISQEEFEDSLMKFKIKQEKALLVDNFLSQRIENNA